jgi:CheY-like chemotaxis protein
MSRPTPRSLRVVVIDDIAELRQLIGLLVIEAGHVVVGEAHDGRAGVAVTLDRTPDLAIMDWHMPELDGVEATRQISARAPEIAVIAFSSAGDPAVRDDFLAAGAGAYVDKGDIAGLEAAIANVASAQ